MSATGLVRAQNAGEVTAEEIVRSFLKRIEEVNGGIHAFVEVYSDEAIEEAKRIDERRKNGEDTGPLAGVPVAVKDCILVQGHKATAGSKILGAYTAAYDATVVSRLRAAGGIIIGRTNMDEFAMGSSTETSAWGATKNPWDTERVPGGSSGGSAAAVAAGMVPLALGSDTGGSVRQPASLCGVVGIKPTYGRLSRYGLIALASSLDQVGVFARTASDAALVLSVCGGKDDRDATSVETDAVIPELVEHDVKGLRVGLPEEYFLEGMDPEIRAAVEASAEVLREGGAKIEKISLPHTAYALATYYVVMPCEASSNLARFDGIRYGDPIATETLLARYTNTRGAGFGREAKRRIMLGTFALSAGYYDAYYKKALQVRAKIREDFDRAFEKVDMILTPTSPCVAWKLGEKFDDPLAMYLADIYTISVNLAGLPGISLPCGLVQGLPAGVQFIGKPFGEYTLLRASAYLQSKTDHHTRIPDV